ncbi:MAG TPA: hypothetical protein VE291_04435 [Terracidiphilus sp.]|jgi:hypothetical protein|nr:hypothetical protein [Terracidiphilus sp.]
MNPRGLIDESKLPSLTAEQLDLLRRYALFEATLDELRKALAGVWSIEFSPTHRTASTHFRVPEPGIVLTREHIANALERRRFDLISERDLAEWATVLLANDAYALDPANEDLIADWLNDIGANLGPH